MSDSPAFPREMIDAFIPPVTPSGRVLKRIANEGSEDTLMRVALGVQVHPTVPSFLDHYRHPGVTSVPIRDLPPSETGLAWLNANRSPKITAFARAATDVLSHMPLSATPPSGLYAGGSLGETDARLTVGGDHSRTASRATRSKPAPGRGAGLVAGRP